MSSKKNREEKKTKHIRWQYKHPLLLWLWPILGFLSFLWFLIRVIPKPSRAAYPCQRLAFPIASSFIIWLIGLGGSVMAYRRTQSLCAKSRYITAALGFAVSIALIWAAMSADTENLPILVADPLPANSPIGTARGIHPGRVVWIYDPNAANWPGSDGVTTPPYWHSDDCTDPEIVREMFSKALRAVTGKSNDFVAWDALFRNFNKHTGRGEAGYTAGEKIAIKINFVLMYSNPPSGEKSSWHLDQIDNSPQLAAALLRQLIDIVGVSAGDISIGDPSMMMPNHWYNMVHSSCPGVVYLTKSGYALSGRTQVTPDYNAPFYWSDPVTSRLADKTQDYIPTHFAQAKYFINFAILKSHTQSGITLAGKNHYGSLRIPTAFGYYDMHWSRLLETQGMGHYRANVDLMAHPNLGGKTLLVLIDGLYSGRGWDSRPIRWDMAPFNGDWPSSIFLSQDQVAADSVAYDFLYNEWNADPTDINGYPQMSGAEDYLHEAAMIPNPPSGTTYDPNHNGGLTQSLGVHEHWNNAIDKQYTRNLGTGDGIELLKVSSIPDADFNNDGIVNFIDFAILAQYWGQSNASVDIAPIPVTDGIVNVNDLAVLSENWLFNN